MNGFEDIRQRLKTVKATGWSPFVSLVQNNQAVDMGLAIPLPVAA
jgi:hypothetical protein